MPSVIVGGASGGQNILSGAMFSGRIAPIGGVQLRWDRTASGNLYVGLSGGVTRTSGGVLGVSGTYLSGQMDGMVLYPGDPYFIPKLGTGGNTSFTSGGPSIWVTPDAAASGQGRLFWQVY